MWERTALECRVSLKGVGCLRWKTETIVELLVSIRGFPLKELVSAVLNPEALQETQNEYLRQVSRI